MAERPSAGPQLWRDLSPQSDGTTLTQAERNAAMRALMPLPTHQQPWYLRAEPLRDPHCTGGAWGTPCPAAGDLPDWYSDFDYDAVCRDWGREMQTNRAMLMAARTVQHSADMKADAEQEGRYKPPSRGDSMYTTDSDGSRRPARPTYMESLNYDSRYHEWNKQWADDSSPNRYRKGGRTGGMDRTRLRRLAWKRCADIPDGRSPSPSPGAGDEDEVELKPMPGSLRWERLPHAVAMAGFTFVSPDQLRQLAAEVGNAGPPVPLSWAQFNALCDALVLARMERVAAFRALQHGVTGRGACIYGFDLPACLASAGFPDVDESQVLGICARFQPPLQPKDRVDLRQFDTICNALSMPNAVDPPLSPRPGSPRACVLVAADDAPAVPGSREWQKGGGEAVKPKKEKGEKPARPPRAAYEKRLAEKVVLPACVQAGLMPRREYFDDAQPRPG